VANRIVFCSSPFRIFVGLHLQQIKL